jgi:hypothetical protein
MRWLTMADGHVDIEVVRALDVCPARGWEFGRQQHVGAERGGGGLGEDGPERWASSASDDGVVTGGRPAHERSWAGGQRDVGPTRRKRPETLF